jgi:methylenetetrahydrofolate dehydrogenase (NADP+)/methenyltetrahydrofolate cyclohydrolase
MVDISTLLDGKKLAIQELQTLAIQVQEAIAQGQRPPCLVVIQIGDDPASNVYIARKQAACEQIGIEAMLVKLPDNVTEATLLQTISTANADKTVDGILIQLPLPSYINKERVLEAILPHKDVDGFHPYHLGRLAQGQPSVRPCTPFGIMRLLEAYEINLVGTRALILGRSTIVGRPMMLELCNAGATVTLAHRQSRDLPTLVANTQLLISATGVVDVIDSHWIPEGAIVVDVGMHHLEDGRLRGDLDGTIVSERANYYTPVPGGVGPMTVASLMHNTWQAYRGHIGPLT